MTSGNLAGEPIVIDDTEALHRLADLADAWLTHNRPIHVPCDDSVTRAVDGRESPIRRSRGQAPLPVDLPFESPAALGVGADVKNTFCIADGRLAWMSAHVGDMDDLSTLLAFGAAEQHLEMLTGVSPTVLAADRHPAYRSRRWALDHASGRPVEGVQHHHAHVAATMADNQVPMASGFSVWPSTAPATARTAPYGAGSSSSPTTARSSGPAIFRTSPFRAATPACATPTAWRSPTCEAPASAGTRGCPVSGRATRDELALLERQLDTGFGCAPTSSMGRLFDAIASIAGICHRAGYDAQAAMELEALARSVGPVEGYRFGVGESSTTPVDPGPVIRQASSDVLDGAVPALVAARFQQGVVDMVRAVLRRLRDQTGLNRATLSGGVFLNSFLTSRCASALTADNFEVLQHHRVPASDAGIALGQVAVLAHIRQPPRTTNRRPKPPEKETPCA